ncbi:MAG: response regulator [Nitrospirota bacterium]
MENRTFEKMTVNLYATIIFGGKTYDGYIENVSTESNEYLMTFLVKVTEDFKPEKKAEIYFKIPSSETINLTCKIKWFFISPCNNNTEVLGIEIQDPSPRYKEFIKSLSYAPELVKQELTIGNGKHECRSLYNQINYGDRKKVNIILAEDNIADQKKALCMLDRQDYAVEVANNGKEVLEGLKKQPFDIILMDVHMPKMDGIEATQTIRNSKNKAFNPEIPIIAVTAEDLEEERDCCLKAGANSYIVKPFDKEEIFNEIDKFLLDDNILS